MKQRKQNKLTCDKWRDKKKRRKERKSESKNSRSTDQCTCRIERVFDLEDDSKQI